MSGQLDPSDLVGMSFWIISARRNRPVKGC